MRLLDDNQKKVVTARLYSLSVGGLNLSPLGGKTLVQYSGSLTGRDFRSVVQIAPFVLYDAIPPEHFRAWLALGSLIPQIWLQEIEDIDTHLARSFRFVLF